MSLPLLRWLYFFFFNDPATTEIYPLSLHDALPISRLLPIALPPATALAAAPAFADPPHHARGNGPPPHAGGPHNRDAPPPGWQKKAWRRGDRLPWAEVDRRYWVDDYARYDLREPGRDRRWVRQSDSEYLLVEIATGLIIDALHR